jgi:endonuclease/exonuclease/phosphatase family metal-dependent hydrolase
MLKGINYVIRIMIWLIVALIVITGAVLTYFTVTEYKPPLREPLKVMGHARKEIKDTLTFLTWNIGYAGLGREMDFFYEGGTQVRPSPKDARRYLEGIIDLLMKNDSVDFVLLQEVDRRARRSYDTDQVGEIQAHLSSFTSVYAYNYVSKFVPLPLRNPMGGVKSGLMLLSRYEPQQAVRYNLQSRYPWPKRLFLLDRCFILTRYPMADGHDLVVINTHNSAFEDAALLRQKELVIIKETLEEEYTHGNYVIIGGDWNQNPLPYDQNQITSGDQVKAIMPGIPGDFLPEGWTWAYDPSLPTNRDVDKPYSEGASPTTIIDFYVLSPNITLLNVHTLATRFAFSDHQPVLMRITLRER